MQALAWNCTELGKESDKAGQWKPLVVGLTLMVCTYSFASVSGAHLNPAVSVAVGLSNMGDWKRLAKYVVMQALGCAVGVALSCATYQKTAAAAIGPRGGHSNADAVVCEAMFTAMVCFVYLNVMLSRNNNSVKGGNQFYALAIGFALAAGCWAVEDVSGAHFNPALSVAVDFQNVTQGVGHGIQYMFAQVLGAFIAAMGYRVMRPAEDAQIDHDSFEEYGRSHAEVVSFPKLVAEGVGTFLVVVTFGCTALSKTYHDERPFAAAAALISMHYSVADLTGGIFNPAVTASLMFNGRGKCSFTQGMAYIVTQIVCAGLAGFCYTAIRGKNFPAVPLESIQKYGASQIAVVDSIYAFLVCYTALATITVVGVKSKLNRNYFDGLAYGFSSAVGGFATLKLLNSLANPAMTLGLALSHCVLTGNITVEVISVSFSQFIGAILASGVFRITHAADFRRHRFKEGECSPLFPHSQADAEAKEAFEGHRVFG